jgi:hypothetical protein
MKKINTLKFMLLMVTMFCFSAVAIVLLTAPTKNVFAEAIWNGSDGTTANKNAVFSGGSGIEGDPYLISTAADLAQLSSNINAELTTYITAHYKLKNNIYLNDETFNLDSDTGLVVMTDGENTAYIGTGVLGNGSGDNTTFDIVASDIGACYIDTNGTVGTYTGIVNYWFSIGNETKYFWGKFDGAGYEISGIYINSEISYQGLFGKTNSVSEIRNIGITNSYIKGKDCVGGIAGANAGIISNSYNTASIIGGSFYVGSIVGTNSGRVSNSYNIGTVIGKSYVGGIAGYFFGTINNSYNIGTVIGNNYTGGIAAYVVYTSTISNSHNNGTVIGSNYVGGIAGINNGTVNNSYNTGAVTGKGGYVGGIAGDNGDNSGTISNCYNIGAVKGESGYIGGIAGNNSGTISNSYNIGSVIGNSRAGGVAGLSNGTISNCYYLISCAKDITNVIQFGIGHTNQGLTTADVADITTSFNTSAVCSSNVTVGAYVGTSLFDVLNAWVNSQVTPNNFINWTHISVEDVYPILPLNVCKTITIYYNGSETLQEVYFTLLDGVDTYELTGAEGIFNFFVVNGTYKLLMNGVDTGVIVNVDGLEKEFTVYLYSVSYDNNGATGTTPIMAYYGEGVEFTVKNNSGGLKITGYSFAGFGLTADAEIAETTIVMGANPLTLYALFELSAPIAELSDNSSKLFYGDIIGVTYSHELKEETGASVSYEWKIDDVTVGLTDTYKPNASPNPYDISCTVTFSFDGNQTSSTVTKIYNINKKQLSTPTVKGTYTYNKAEQTAEFEGFNEELMTIVSGDKATVAGEHTAQFGIIDIENYEWIDEEGSVNWSIAKADAVITVDQKPISFTYGDEVVIPEATSNFGTVNIYNAPFGKIGNYVITYTVSDSDNYNEDTKVVVITINKKPITVTAESKKIIEGENDVELTYTLSENALVGNDTISGNLTRAVGTDAGKYLISIGTLTAGDNYDITYVSSYYTINNSEIQSNISGSDNVQSYVTSTVGFNPDISFDLKTVELSSLTIPEGKENIQTYRIQFYNNNQEINYTETIKIRLTAPLEIRDMKECQILIKENGAYVTKTAKIENGFIVFETSAPEYFSIIKDAKSGILTYLLIGGALLVSLVTIGIFVIKKKNKTIKK